MTILVFPCVIDAALIFASEARRWGEQIVGASSLEIDVTAVHYDAWENIPFIGDDHFFPKLKAIIERHHITTIFTPHASTFHLLEKELPVRIPSVKLFGEGPFKFQMNRINEYLFASASGVEAVTRYGEVQPSFPKEFLAGLLAKADTIHGECSRDKIFALCGIIPIAPKGDIVEIGALYGKSSYILNRLATYYDIGATLCIDPWDLGLSIQHDASENIQKSSEGWDWETVYHGFLINMLGCGATRFNYLRAKSSDAFHQYATTSILKSAEFGATLFERKIAVLHLDGNHDEAAVAEDFALWSQYVVPNGWIIFDDYNWAHGDGPRKVANAAIQNYGPKIKRSFVAGGAMFINISG